jgi:hypothetical protein
MSLGKCSIEFFNFHHCQVQNLQISNQSDRHQNFVVNFWKQQKQKSTKYIKID